MLKKIISLNKKKIYKSKKKYSRHKYKAAVSKKS